MNAGCADCPLCRVWYERPLCCAPVMGSVVVCWAWFRLRHGVQSVIPDVRGSDRTPIVEGVIPGWCGRHRPLATRRTATGAPNPALQLTASRARS